MIGVYPSSQQGALFAVDGSTLEHEPGIVGYLPQDAHLFSGSARDNILMAAAAGDAKFVAHAVRLAALDTDIAAFPRGLDTQIGELGVRISGGQRQRLGLARAIAAYAPDPPSALLNDPFSAIVETGRASLQLCAKLRRAEPAEKRANSFAPSAWQLSPPIEYRARERQDEEQAHMMSDGARRPGRRIKAQARSDADRTGRNMSVAVVGVARARFGHGLQISCGPCLHLW